MEQFSEAKDASFAFDGTYFYVITAHSLLIRLATASEAVLELASIDRLFSSLHVGDGQLYWRGDGAGDGVFRIAADGSEQAPSLLVPPADRPPPANCDAQAATFLGVADGQPIMVENVFSCEYTDDRDYVYYEDQTIFSVADDPSGAQVFPTDVVWNHQRVSLRGSSLVGIDESNRGVEVDLASGAVVRKTDVLDYPREGGSLHLSEHHLFFSLRSGDQHNHIHMRDPSWATN